MHTQAPTGCYVQISLCLRLTEYRSISQMPNAPGELLIGLAFGSQHTEERMAHTPGCKRPLLVEHLFELFHQIMLPDLSLCQMSVKRKNMTHIEDCMRGSSSFNLSFAFPTTNPSWKPLDKFMCSHISRCIDSDCSANFFFFFFFETCYKTLRGLRCGIHVTLLKAD